MALTISLWVRVISLTATGAGLSSPPPFLLPTSPSISSRDLPPFLLDFVDEESPAEAPVGVEPASEPFLVSPDPLLEAVSPLLRCPLSPLPDPPTWPATGTPVK